MGRGSKKRKGSLPPTSLPPSTKKGKQRSAPTSPEPSECESVSEDSFMSSSGSSTNSLTPPITTPAKNNKIPPIFVQTNAKLPWHILAKEMFSSPGLEQVMAKTTSKQGQIIINCPDNESFRLIQAFLEKKKDAIGYHTFSIPEDRPIKIAIKGIPLDITDEELTTELKTRGFKPTTVRAFMKDGRRIPIHMVVLERDTDTKEIFDIKDLFYVQVKIEAYKQTGITQCFNCQRFGHSSLRCGFSPRCVKCGSDHNTKHCTKPKDQPGKCCNCGADHTANYRGCPSHTTAVSQTTIKPTKTQPTILLPTEKTLSPIQGTVTNSNSYATATKSAINNQSDIATIITIVKELLKTVIDSPDSPTKTAVLKTILKILDKKSTNDG